MLKKSAIGLAILLAAQAQGAPDALHPYEIGAGGMLRQYHVYAPPRLPAHPALVIAFHPSGSTGQGMRNMAGATLERMAREHGFLIAYPDGFERHFNDCRNQSNTSAHTRHVDDVAFSLAMVGQLESEYGVDPKRIVALGFSNGGYMALRLALETPELIAGAIAIGANMPVADNQGCTVSDAAQPNIALIEGTADPVNPYEGGEVNLYGLGQRGQVLSALDSAHWFAKRYGLAGTPSTQPSAVEQGMTAHIDDWGHDHPLVRLIAIEGGGHTIPQADYRFPVLLGRTYGGNAPLDAAWAAMGVRDSGSEQAEDDVAGKRPAS